MRAGTIKQVWCHTERVSINRHSPLLCVEMNNTDLSLSANIDLLHISLRKMGGTLHDLDPDGITEEMGC